MMSLPFSTSNTHSFLHLIFLILFFVTHATRILLVVGKSWKNGESMGHSKRVIEKRKHTNEKTNFMHKKLAKSNHI